VEIVTATNRIIDTDFMLFSSQNRQI